MSKLKSTKDIVSEHEKKGEVVFMTFDGMAYAKIDEFIKQPAEGILYDLNRDKVTLLLQFSEENIRWVNDYAVALTIIALRDRISELESENQRSKELMFGKLKENRDYIPGNIILREIDEGKFAGEMTNITLKVIAKQLLEERHLTERLQLENDSHIKLANDLYLLLVDNKVTKKLADRILEKHNKPLPPVPNGEE